MKLMKYRLIKILFTTFVLLMVAFRATAPSREEITILTPAPVEPYKQLINAIGMVETKYDTLAYNPVEQAVGFFQIRPIRLEDYNKRTGNHYKMKDLYDYKTSEKIFLYYAEQIGPHDFEKIAKRWNGSGPRTYLYWSRIKKLL